MIRKVDEFEYIFDNQNNLIEIKENTNTIVKYTYNKFSKLIREDNKYLNKTLIFKYSTLGNLTEKTEYDFSLKVEPKIYVFKQKFYESGNKLFSYNDEKFSYNELGMPTKYRNANFKWCYDKLLKIDNIVEYEYKNEKRVGKKFDNVQVKFDWLGNNLIRQFDGNVFEFNYDLDSLIGFSLTCSNSFKHVFKYKKNIFGDIVGIYDINNVLFCKYYYDSWGNYCCYILNFKGQYIKLENLLQKNQTKPIYEFVAQINPYRFRGYYFDFETGLYYNLGRYYDPEIGKFIN